MDPPTKLLLLVVSLLTYAGCALSAIRCPNCGTTPVPYPLSTSSSCGDQDYKIRCDSSGNLHFDTLNNSYPITAINPSSQRLVIKPSSLLPNTCITSDLMSQGVRLNDSLPFNITSSNTIMYMNCTPTLLSSPLNCTSSSLCHVYINGTSNAAPCEDGICCTFRAGGSSTSYMIRVRQSGCRAYTSFVNLNPNLPLNRWGEPGLELQWLSPREPVCGSQADCDRNSTCGPDARESGVRRCFCMSGLLWDPIKGVCAESGSFFDVLTDYFSDN